MTTKIKSRFKILDFDIEARPLSWYSFDYVSKEVTAIAAKFIGDDSPVKVWLLGENTPQEMLEGFLEMYKEAGMVTGHYIKGYDLPSINASLIEYGYYPLDSKLAQDTKIDLIKKDGVSASQENMSEMLGLEADKINMSQRDWRLANRLTKEGIEKTKKRVVGDVIQHIEFREKLLKQKLLGPPKLWSSIGQNKPKYFG